MKKALIKAVLAGLTRYGDRDDETTYCQNCGKPNFWTNVCCSGCGKPL